MIKSAFAALAAAPGFAGSDYVGTVTDFHVGYEGTTGAAAWYIQGGPSVISPDGGAAETKFSAKTGGSIAATERLGVYGEISFVNGSTNSYGTKAGLKYSF